jgi:DNA-binding transcriptional LysR family regulator
MIDMKPLDLDQVQTFALVADLKSFTRAAEASGATQSAVSLKLKRLEERLGHRLVERTPRLVRLTAEGNTFLEHARELLVVHERALGAEKPKDVRLSLGVSDHAAGDALATLLARVNAYDPSLVLEVDIGFSATLLKSFDRGDLEAVIVRREAKRRDGEKLIADEFGWFASPRFRYRAGEPLRLASLAPPCGVRAMAIRALDKAKIDWVESFVGGGVSAVCAAVSSGFAATALPRRIAPPDAIDIGRVYGLPPLKRSDVVLYSRVSDPRRRAALRTLAAAFRATVLERA